MALKYDIKTHINDFRFIHNVRPSKKKWLIEVSEVSEDKVNLVCG